jgi:c-di-GMP-binding flagellar brake protein YcgR
MVEENEDAKERRRQNRFSLESFLAVYRQEDHLLMGHIIDISRGGMLLVSKQRVPLNKTFSFLLEISLTDDLPEKVTARAKSIWNRKDPNPGLFNNGFQFVDLSIETEQAIDHLVAELKAL